MKRVLMWLLTVGVVGWVIFGAWIWRSSSVHSTSEAAAWREFGAVRARMAGEPWLTRGPDGRFARTGAGSASAPSARVLKVMVWRADRRRLATTAVPLWFLNLKEIPVGIVLGRAGVDLHELGLRPRDLQRRGAGVVLDEIFLNKDRLLIWTE